MKPKLTTIKKKITPKPAKPCAEGFTTVTTLPNGDKVFKREEKK